jgi:hypothetical protein
LNNLSGQQLLNIEVMKNILPMEIIQVTAVKAIIPTQTAALRVRLMFPVTAMFSLTRFL